MLDELRTESLPFSSLVVEHFHAIIPKSSPKRFPACGSAVLPTWFRMKWFYIFLPVFHPGQSVRIATTWQFGPRFRHVKTLTFVDHRNVKNQSPFKGVPIGFLIFYSINRPSISRGPMVLAFVKWGLPNNNLNCQKMEPASTIFAFQFPAFPCLHVHPR
jgi:hypothetical protein